MSDVDFESLIAGIFIGSLSLWYIQHAYEEYKLGKKKVKAKKEIENYKLMFNQERASPEEIIVAFDELYSYTPLFNKEEIVQFDKDILLILGDSLESILAPGNDLSKYAFLRKNKSLRLHDQYDLVRIVSKECDWVDVANERYG